MSELQQPDRPILESWLSDIHIEHYLCSECEGLHLSALQSLEGVVNSRLFVQKGNILFSTEVEIRPMAILPLSADLGRINMDYPTLKVFLDVVDDATPQLVIAANQSYSAGLAQAQFADFVVSAMDGMRLLADECLRMDYLFAEVGGAGMPENRSVH